MADSDLIKTDQEIKIMREGGKILAQILDNLKNMIEPELEAWALEEEFIKECKDHNVLPACKGYTTYGLPPFPTGLCISVNAQSVHCIPKKGQILKKGDIITVDTVIEHKKLNLDSAFCTVVGEVPGRRMEQVKACEKAMYQAISQVQAGKRIGLVSNTLQKGAESAGLNVLRDYAGHGIGYDMHEWPEILCYGNKNSGIKMEPGMTICVESLTCSGKPKVVNTSKWETKMADNGDFAQYEHTVLVTKDGFEILTKL